MQTECVHGTVKKISDTENSISSLILFPHIKTGWKNNTATQNSHEDQIH